MAIHERNWLSRIASYLNGDIDLDTAVYENEKSTRHFAKRQFTWYKKMPYISWYDVEHLSEDELLVTVLNDCKAHFNTYNN